MRRASIASIPLLSPAVERIVELIGHRLNRLCRQSGVSSGTAQPSLEIGLVEPVIDPCVKRWI